MTDQWTFENFQMNFSNGYFVIFNSLDDIAWEKTYCVHQNFFVFWLFSKHRKNLVHMQEEIYIAKKKLECIYISTQDNHNEHHPLSTTLALWNPATRTLSSSISLVQVTRKSTQRQEGFSIENHHRSISRLPGQPPLILTAIPMDDFDKRFVRLEAIGFWASMTFSYDLTPFFFSNDGPC